MALKTWKKISESAEHKNSWWIYKKDIAELPSGKIGEYHYVHTNGSSMIVPVLDNGRVVMVNQYRYLNKKESLEFPCGGVKEGSSYEETAINELEEEAGYLTQNNTVIGEFNPFNGVTDEICRVFIARQLIKVQVKPDETEEFESVSLLPEELDARIAAGEIWDGMTITAWVIAKAHILQ